MTHASRRRVSAGLIALLAGGLLPVATHSQTPEQACKDPVPKNCAEVRFLGEDNGCACFVCNPNDKPIRKVVCTRQEADKGVLFKLVSPLAIKTTSSANAAAPAR